MRSTLTYRGLLDRRIGKRWALLVGTILLLLSGCGQQTAITEHASTVPIIHAMKTEPSASATASTASGRMGNPTRLIIPAIGVNAAVETVAVTANGGLAVPVRSPWDDVGWYDQGVRPGEQGSAVIDGHLDRPGGYAAVFWNLRHIQVGDEVKVIDTRGNMLRFRVTKVALYAPREAPVQDIFGNEGGRYLNLITCAGDWIASEHQTTLRLVVYTMLIPTSS